MLRRHDSQITTLLLTFVINWKSNYLKSVFNQTLHEVNRAEITTLFIIKVISSPEKDVEIIVFVLGARRCCRYERGVKASEGVLCVS